MTIKVPSLSNIQTIGKMSRSDLIDLIVTGASIAIATSVPGDHDAAKLNTMADDIERAIWARLNTDGSQVFDRRYEAAGAIVLALAHLDNARMGDDEDQTMSPIHAEHALHRALQHLDPVLAAEVENEDDVMKIYCERWEGRTT